MANLICFADVSLNNQQYKIVTEENVKEKLVLSCAGSGMVCSLPFLYFYFGKILDEPGN